MARLGQNLKRNEKKWDLEAERSIWSAVCAPNGWFNEDGSGGTHPKSLWYFTHICWGCEFVFQSGAKPRWLVEKSVSGYEIHGRYVRWLQENLLEWKRQKKKGKGKRMFLAIILPRNFGKSITATRCASLWTHLDDPDMSTIIGSSTSKLAKDFVESIAATISIDDDRKHNNLSWFCWLYGNWKNPAREWTKESFDHGFRNNVALQESSFEMTAVDIGMTGYHHDQHWWDDPITKNKLRDGGVYLNSVHDAFNASYKALQTDGLLVLVCTRYLDDDVAGRHFLEEGVKSWDGMDCPNTMIFQKFQMGEGVWRVFFWQVEDELTQKATCPEIMDEERIKQEKSLDSEDFACQYQNDPGTSEHAPLTEKQLRDLFIDYKDLRHEYLVECASVHLDTAFKDLETVRSGDDSAIVTYLHDARPESLLLLHTDLLKASNSWRSDEFSDKLVEVLHKLRKETIPVKCITDEKEMGGKVGIYRQNLIATLRGAGVRNFGRFHQFNRQGTRKRSRIRKAAALWADGHVRILLHKDEHGKWIIPDIARKLFNQIMRIDVVKHDDLADAAADVFNEEVWRVPQYEMSLAGEEGMTPRNPGDEGLRAMSRKLTNEELKIILEEETEQGQWLNGLGPDQVFLPERLEWSEY